MNRRELFQKALGVGAAVAAAGILRGQSGSFTGPAGGSRGSQLITIVTGPFDTSSYPNGVRPVTDTPQFATYVRIQAHPGQEGKIGVGGPAMATTTGNVADSAFLELWQTGTAPWITDDQIRGS